jgi:hypothetical protein
MSPANNLVRPYKVEFAPAAWTQVAHLPRDAYFTLQELLRVLAEQAGVGRLSTPQPSGAPESSSSFTFDGFLARYEVDEVRELVRLLEVQSAPQESADAVDSMQRSPSSK